VFRADSDQQEKIESLQLRVKEGVSKLRGLDIGDQLAVEILSQLVDGRKNASEIVELIYGLKRDDEGFNSSYNRVSREIRRLESKGLVSRALFGKEKPYRLTELAVSNLARIGGEGKQVSMVPWYDIAIYLTTLVVTVPTVLHAWDWFQLPEIGTIGLFGFLCFFLGISVCELVRTLRRVF
jgi:hypothetical protein